MGLDYNRGLSLAKLGRYAEAAEAFTTALSLQPDFPDAENNRAAALARVAR